METLDKTVGQRLKVQYIFALLVVASLTILGQIIIQSTLSSSLDDSHVINIAGRQRMLSQRLTKISLILNDPTIPAKQKEVYLKIFPSAYNLWRESHEALKNNKLERPRKYNVTNSREIAELYRNIEPTFTKLSILFKQASDNSLNDESKAEILENERLYLELMEKIVFSYDAEATKRVDSVKSFELILLFLTIGTLLVEAFMIFNPLAMYVKEVISRLTSSEKQLQETNDQLRFSNRMLFQAQEKLEQVTKEKYEAQLQEEKNRSAILLEGQEEERRRMSREMHDGVGQLLTGVKLAAGKLKSLDSTHPKYAATLGNLNELISETIEATRIVSFNLMPPVLGDFGLSSVMKILKESIEKSTKLKVKLDINLLNERLSQNLEINIYRIIQEASNNIIKHAKAKNIVFRILEKDDIVFLEISDDGVGFESQNILEKNQSLIHNGIKNIKTRCELLNGTFKLTTALKEGTNIFIKLPSEK
ncbi:MAG TPA: histidine kinase [Leadbetterella sp.]|nr:histidine kinase [Leadbetterella sp.]